MICSRLAPTPSGFLHLGNAFNFLLTFKLTQRRNGRLLLRIDDVDKDRTKKEFVDDIFETLKWLGIVWEGGPRSCDDFFQNFSQQKKIEKYFNLIEKVNTESLFTCECSRSQIKRHSSIGLYPGTCYDKGLELERGVNSLRFKVAHEELKNSMGDFVFWRKEDYPSYQWFSLVDDIELGVNFIVRGSDLSDSTLAQKEIAKQTGEWGKAFLSCEFLHHPLIEAEGFKLSKSQGSPALKKNSQELDFLNSKVDEFLSQIN